MRQQAAEIRSAGRFAFGRNWARFLRNLDDERIEQARKSLAEKLEMGDLRGKTFIDIGSGSGLFSLAAMQLGAARVHSFDYDPHSVACAEALKQRYFDGSPNWTIDEGSVLDVGYLSSLGQFDVVYSWGVLHHTGDMWKALDNVVPLVAPEGRLFIAIYNDQGTVSGRWRRVKQLYNKLPSSMRFLVLAPCFVALSWRSAVKDCLSLRPFRSIRARKERRGMSFWHDLVDWVGGYPFEVATPRQIFDFYKAHGFALSWLDTCGGTMGCNQFVFRKAAETCAQSAIATSDSSAVPGGA